MATRESEDKTIRKEAAPWVDRSTAKIFCDGAVSVRSLPELAAAVDRMRDRPFQASIVKFDAGARTVTHTHDGDQVLVILDGDGTIGNAENVVAVSSGDVVVVPAGLVHYHASSPPHSLTHVSLLFGTTVLSPSDES